MITTTAEFYRKIPQNIFTQAVIYYFSNTTIFEKSRSPDTIDNTMFLYGLEDDYGIDIDEMVIEQLIADMKNIIIIHIRTTIINDILGVDKY